MNADSPESPADVSSTGLTVTVLGSGGPFLTPNRVSAGYLVWLDGRARLLVDAGGGVFERLGRAGIDTTELDAVLLTHGHIDHSGGLAPLVFAAYVSGRQRPLTVVGQAGNGDQPGCVEICDLLFGPRGAWRYPHSFDGFSIDARDMPSDPEQTQITTALGSPGSRSARWPSRALRRGPHLGPRPDDPRLDRLRCTFLPRSRLSASPAPGQPPLLTAASSCRRRPGSGIRPVAPWNRAPRRQAAGTDPIGSPEDGWTPSWR